MDKVEIIKEIRTAASKLRNGKLKNLDKLAPTLEKIKTAIEEAFSGCTPTLDSLKEIWSEERLARPTSHRIGFASGT